MWKAVLWQGKSWDFGTVNRNRQEPDSLVFRSRLGFLLSVCLGAQGKLLHLFLLISPGEKEKTAKNQRRGKDSPSAHHIASHGAAGEWYTEPASVVCLLQELFPIHPGNRTRAPGNAFLTPPEQYCSISSPGSLATGIASLL